MRIMDWSSDVCSSDLTGVYDAAAGDARHRRADRAGRPADGRDGRPALRPAGRLDDPRTDGAAGGVPVAGDVGAARISLSSTVRRISARPLRAVGPAAVRGSPAPYRRLVRRTGAGRRGGEPCDRSEEPTSELQSLMRISYAGVCL